MIQAWFVSDIHIADSSDPKAKIFLAFLQSLKTERPCTHLFLLGDIFDLWVGDHQYFQKKFEAIVFEIQRLVEVGVEVHYFEGNHDLHLSSYWEKQLHVKVHENPIFYKLGDKVFLLEHGDESDPEDKGYLFLRKFLRTSPMRWLSESLPGVAVSYIGEKASAKSRVYTSEQKTVSESIAIEKLRSHAERMFQLKPFDFLINGHVHLVDDYKSNSGFRSINLGTWLKEPVALSFDGAQFSFHNL